MTLPASQHNVQRYVRCSGARHSFKSFETVKFTQSKLGDVLSQATTDTTHSTLSSEARFVGMRTGLSHSSRQAGLHTSNLASEASPTRSLGSGARSPRRNLKGQVPNERVRYSRLHWWLTLCCNPYPANCTHPSTETCRGHQLGVAGQCCCRERRRKRRAITYR